MSEWATNEPDRFEGQGNLALAVYGDADHRAAQEAFHGPTFQGEPGTITQGFDAVAGTWRPLYLRDDGFGATFAVTGTPYYVGEGWDDAVGEQLEKYAPIAATLFATAGLGALVAPALAAVGLGSGVAGTIAGKVAMAAVKPTVAQALGLAPATNRQPALQVAQPRRTTMGENDGIFSGLPAFDWGGLTNTLLQIAVNRESNQQSAAPMQLPPLQLPGMQQVALPGIGAIAGGAARMLGVGGAMSVAVGAIRSVAGKVIGFLLPSGVKVSRASAVKLAREVGIVAAASALGATAAEVAEAILEEDKRPRRGRAITAAAVRTTTRTIGRIEKLHKRIAKVARAHVR